MTSHTIGERLNTNYGQKIKSADVGRNGGLDTKSTKNIARIDYANKIMWYGRNYWKKENKRVEQCLLQKQYLLLFNLTALLF